MPKALLCACHWTLPYLEMCSKTVVESPYWLHTWRTNQCSTFSWRSQHGARDSSGGGGGPLRVESEQGDICSAADLGEGKGVVLNSLNGLFLLKIHIYINILEWQGHRNQQKVIHTPYFYTMWWPSWVMKWGAHAKHPFTSWNMLANQMVKH